MVRSSFVVAATLAFGFAAADAAFAEDMVKIGDLVIGLRVSEEVEREGLDLALHGEVVQ